MEDFIIAGLVLLLFVVFLFRRQSFADALSPSPCTPAAVPTGRSCQTNAKGVPQTRATSCPSAYPNAVPSGCNNLNYCCQ